MPSESASFPDLVGQPHGYLPPHLVHWPARRRQNRSTAQLRTPALATITAIYRAPLLLLDRPSQPSVSVEPMHQVEEQDTHRQATAKQLVSPTTHPATPETPTLFEAENDTAVIGSTRNGRDPKKAVRADSSRSWHVAIPVLKRSPRQIESQLRVQNIGRPTQETRCRTPARGLAIAQPRPFMQEKASSTSSSASSTQTVPQHCSVGLRDFMSWEAFTVGILLLSMGAGLSQQLEESPLSSVLKVVAVAAGIAATTVPAIFLWRGRRVAAKVP